MKSTFLNETFLSQIDRRVEALRGTKDKANIRGGWIKFMRQALGLTMQELSHLLSLSPSGIAQAEKREVQGKISLETLQRFATAMDCELVYSFVPRKDIRTFIHDKAMEKARITLHSADHHMKLEDQKVSGAEDERIVRLAKKFIENGDIW